MTITDIEALTSGDSFVSTGSKILCTGILAIGIDDAGKLDVVIGNSA